MIFFAHFAPKSLNLIGNWVPKSLNLQNHLFITLFPLLPVSPTSLTVLVLVLVLKPPFSSVLVTVEGYGKVIAVIKLNHAFSVVLVSCKNITTHFPGEPRHLPVKGKYQAMGNSR